MKKILLSFSLIVAFVLFATFARRNVGIGADRFLAPSFPLLSTPDASGPTYVPKRVLNSSDDSVSSPTPTPVPVVSRGQYKDGSYTGSVADAYYGNIQVKAVITGGKLTDVLFLQYPHDRGTSVEINTQAMPYLKSEAIQIQSGNVNIVSGATDSSIAFRESMSSALVQAKN